jgi:hypothetical protein
MPMSKASSPAVTQKTGDRHAAREFALNSLVVTLLLSPLSASAYVDPNTGGLLFQLLAPLFAAIAGGWLFLRRWIASLFHRLRQIVTRRSD